MPRLALGDALDRRAQRAESLTEEQLRQPAPGRKYSVGFLLAGIAQHSAYRAGRIALLRKLR